MIPAIFFSFLLFIGIRMIVSMILKSRFAAYIKIPLSARLTEGDFSINVQGEGIYDVKVVSVEGFLSSHYNPQQDHQS